MARLKKAVAESVAKPPLHKTTSRDKTQQSHANKSITESAQQIWLAGIGAFNRAQTEGSKLFETLVRDGLSLGKTARKATGTLKPASTKVKKVVTPAAVAKTVKPAKPPRKVRTTKPAAATKATPAADSTA